MTSPLSGPNSSAGFIHLFGNKIRVQILAYLWKCERSKTNDIAQEIGNGPSTVRTHCQMLQEAKLLQKRDYEGTQFWQLTTKGETAAGKIARPLLEVAPGRQ